MSKKTIQQKHPTTTMVLKPSILKVFLLLLILVIYGRTTKYEFTLDDDLFVINNPTVQKGISGISEAFSKGSLEHFRDRISRSIARAPSAYYVLRNKFLEMTRRDFTS